MNAQLIVLKNKGSNFAKTAEKPKLATHAMRNSKRAL